MKKIAAIILFLFILPIFAKAISLGSELSGIILLNVEGNGEAWYIYPEDNKRYYLGRPADAFQIMRELGLGITHNELENYLDSNFPGSLSGKILLDVEQNGEAYYIYPNDLRGYYLGRPADAFQIMRELSLGITRENLAKVHKAGLDESLNKYSKYEYRIITTSSGDFTIDIVEIDLDNPKLKIIADTKDDEIVKGTGNYNAQSLAEYVIDNNGFIGMNGSYFCSQSGCGGLNYYFYPVYNKNIDDMINKSELKYWTTGPIMAFDANNKFYYFKDSRDFPYNGWRISSDTSISEAFFLTYGVELQAAIGNKPRLIEEGLNSLIDWEVDDKQKNVKSLRNAIGHKNGKIYLVVAHNATVPELADVMQALEVEYALNLDGGYSSALWYNDEYMVGPGRDVPNAIVFAE